MNKKKYQAKFPMARIKKIMQKDEEVGKIALMTPVVMSKAVELFMAALVNAASTQAKGTASKRILPQHLKGAIHSVEAFDFLKELVVNVPALSDQKEEATHAVASSVSAKKKKV